MYELEDLSQRRSSISGPKLAPVMCMHPAPMPVDSNSEMTVHNAYGEYPTGMSRASRNDSYPSTVTQLCSEPHDLPDYDVEGRNEKWFP